MEKSDRKFVFHLLGLVHLPTARKYTSCAFTCKNVKLAKMLCDLGHTVYLYGCRSTEEGPLEEYIQSDKFHFIETHTADEIAETWGDGDNRFEIGYDWTNADFRHDFNSERTQLTKYFNLKVIRKIKARRLPDHFLLCTQGSYQAHIAEAVGLYLTCEPGVGYRGSHSNRFRAFESSYIQNFTYGSEHPYECINGSYYDRVIPNYFDVNDFKPRLDKDDYYLFIGRMIKRKGILTAAMACNHLGKKLIIAGQGAHVNRYGHLIPNEDPDFDLPPGTWEYVGYVDAEQRNKLMAGAIATFTPTEYLECFGGTHIESMLCGTPPITTNFGVFPGTIPDPINGVVGYRCNTLQDFVDAAQAAERMTPGQRMSIENYAHEHFSMQAVALQYEKWFQDLYNVYESSVQDGVKGWSRLTKITQHAESI